MEIKQRRQFAKAIKSMPRAAKKDVDNAVRRIAADPEKGKQLKGLLSGLRSYRCHLNKNAARLVYAYEPEAQRIILYAVGPRDNIYRDISK